MRLKFFPAIIFLFFIFINISSSAQWVQQNVNSSNTLYDVEYVNSSCILIGGSDGSIKSLDGGTTWTTLPLKDEQNIDIPASIIRDIYFFDQNVGIATGMISLANSEVILKTNNGGLTWKTVSVYNGGTWPRLINEVDFVGSTGFAVGTNGRILKTTDKGDTWSLVSSPVNKEFKSISMIDANNIVLVGDGIVLKSINGGISWTSFSYPNYYFNSVDFGNSSNGIAAGNNGIILKTSDGGNTWSTTNLGANEIFNKVKFYSPSVIYLTGSTIYKSSSQGDFWEKEITPKLLYYNSIDLYNDHAFAVGANGNAIKTSSTNTPLFPIASFNSSSTTYCKDTLVHFINNGPDNYSYQWILDNTIIGTSKNLDYAFSDSDVNHIIKLVAYNGMNYDTASSPVHVQKSLDINLTASVSENMICPGYSLAISVQFSEPEVTYQLKRKSIQIGAQQPGNGQTLIFNTGSINKTDTFNIVASKTNPCGTNQVSKEFIISTQDALPEIVWNKLSIPGNSNSLTEIKSVDFINKDTGFVVTYSNSQFLKTVDGGKNWSIKFLGEDNNAIDFVDDTVGYVPIGNGLYKTVDGGKTFFHPTTPFTGTQFQAVNFIDKNVGFLITGASYIDIQRIFKTTDGAKTWTEQYRGSEGSDGMQKIFCVNKDTCYCPVFVNAYPNVDTSYFLKTTNGGTTWNVITFPYKRGLYDVYFTDSKTGYGVVDGKIFKTTDGGFNWVGQQVIVGNGNEMFRSITFTDKNTGYAVGDYRTTAPNGSFVYKTVNAGQCWQLVSRLPDEILDNIVFPEPDIAYLVGGELLFGKGVIYKTKLSGQWLSFSVSDSLVCLGDSLHVMNKSRDYDTYKWLVNGAVKKNTFDAYLNFNTAGTYEIMLVGSKGTVSDTTKRMIRVSSPLPITVSTPFNQSVCEGNLNVNFTVSTTGGRYIKYKWELNTGSGYKDIDTIVHPYILNVQSRQITINQQKAFMNGWLFRCKVSGKCSPDIYSNGATLTIYSPISIIRQPLTDTVCVNSSAYFSLKVSGSVKSYQWQYKPYTAFINASISPYSGDKTDSLRASSVTTSMHDYSYKCNITGWCNNLTSDIVQLKVKSTVISSHPRPQVVCPNSNAYFDIVASGFDQIYQWQADKGTGFQNLQNDLVYQNVNTQKLLINNVPTSLDNYSYRCVITGGCPSLAISNSNTLKVINPFAILTNPSDAMVCEGNTATFNFTTAESVPVSYMWQVNKGTGYSYVSPGAEYSGENTTTLTVNTGVGGSKNNFKFRCVLSGPCIQRDTTDEVTLFALGLPIANAGIDINSCNSSSVQLGGAITNAITSSWNTNGTGKFIPDNTSLTVSYQPSVQDISNGKVSISLTPFNSNCTGLSDTLIVTFGTCTGIEALSGTSEMKIYPNPVSNSNDNLLHLESSIPIMQVSIYNSVGLKIKDLSASSISSTISLDNMKPGTYLIKITTSDEEEYWGYVIKN